MSNFRLKVNGTTEFDGDLSEYRTVAPDFVKDRIKPGVKPELWMQTVMVVMTNAVTARQDVIVSVDHGEKVWSMTVEHP